MLSKLNAVRCSAYAALSSLLILISTRSMASQVEIDGVTPDDSLDVGLGEILGILVGLAQGNFILILVVILFFVITIGVIISFKGSMVVTGLFILIWFVFGLAVMINFVSSTTVTPDMIMAACEQGALQCQGFG